MLVLQGDQDKNSTRSCSRHCAIIVLILTLLLCSQAQAQTLDRLDEENGFCEVDLLSDIDTLAGFSSILKDPDITNSLYDFAMIGCQHSYLGEEPVYLGRFRVKKIFLCTSGQLVTEIRAIFDHDSALFHYLYNRYGYPNIPFRTVRDFENKKAAWSVGLWQARNVRLMLSAKKYYRREDSEKSDTPDYIYLRMSSVEADKWIIKKPDE